MKIEIQTQKIKEIIQKIDRIAGKHTTLPVLSCILIEFNKNTAIFKATNLDVGIEVSIPIKSEGSGAVAVPAHTLSAFISQLPDQNGVVSMEIDGGNIKITTPHSNGVIKTVPIDDFPTIPKVVDGQTYDLPADVFIKGLKSVWYSASVSSIKPELSSIYIYRDGEYINFAATDSFRLAEKKVKAPNTAKMGDILIPFKNIADIVRFLEGVGGTVKVTTSKNLISFSENGTYLVSRVIDGVFPDYHQIIPKSFITEAVILKQDFINALKISNIFSDRFNQIKLVIDPKKKVFDIQTKNSDVGENKTSVSAALSGEQIEVNFNYKYVADCFQSIEADSLSLQLGGLNKPMLIRSVSGDQTFLYIVMPMNR
ncbi:MAG: DNA polymerase III subunit beta [Candidatus Taylorbacteria bacterium]